MTKSSVSRNKHWLTFGLLSLIVTIALWVLCSLMFELYSKRQTLSSIFFHSGLVSLLFSSVFLVSWFFRFEKEDFYKTVLVAVSISVSLCLFEVGLRIDGRFYTALEQSGNGLYYSFLRDQYQDSWYWVRPADTTLNFPRKEFEFIRTTNSYGLSERPIEKHSVNFRILGLGDSFTEGTGVAQDSTWLRRVEFRLNSSKVFGMVETINAGVGGSDPVYSYTLLEDELLEFGPDVVILSVNSSDITDIAYRGGFERFHADGTAGRKPPKWEWFYQVSHLVRLIAHNGFQLNHYLVSPEDEEKGRGIALESLKQVATNLNSLASEEGFEPLIVIHPIIYDFKSPDYLDIELVEFKTFLKTTGFSYIDLKEEFDKIGVTNYTSASQFYWELDRHFNQKGYDFFGDCVTHYLMEEVLHKSDSIPTN